MEESLETKIENIKKVLDVEQIAALSADQSYVRKYYKANKIPYSLFHSATDRMHMGLSRDGIYKQSDLLGIAEILAKYISKIDAKRVLELATGRGADSFYLATQFPSTSFFGIDISETQLSRAHAKAAQVSNYSPALGDYHDLSRFADATFDLIFVIEALCHSTMKEKVLREANRVLKNGGLLIVVDGYLNKEEDKLTESEKLACALVEKGMAVADFESYASFLEKARIYFQLVHEEDFSRHVIPTMRRFERLGRKFFEHPRLAKIIAKILPQEITNNAATGYLMPTVMEIGLYSYMLTVLAK